MLLKGGEPPDCTEGLIIITFAFFSFELTFEGNMMGGPLSMILLFITFEITRVQWHMHVLHFTTLT